MKFISTKHFNRSILSVIKRFPFVLFALVLTVVSLVILLEQTEIFNNSLAKIALTSCLGILIFLNTKLIKEQYKLHDLKYYLINLGLIIMLFGYYYMLPNIVEESVSSYIQFFGLMASLHMVTAYILYVKQNNIADFITFNMLILSRLLESFLFVLLLFATISLATVSIENLFEVEIMTGKRYSQLFILMVGLVQGMYFLSSFPSQFNQIPKIQHSKAFGVFAQFILIPVVMIYALIIYAYAIKLVSLKIWPEDWLITVSMWFFVVGILTYLFNFSYKDQASNQWSYKFTKWYFPIALPLSILLILPVYKRIVDFGITDENYLLSAVIVWTLFVGIYIILSKKNNIKIFPISLSIICLVAVLGPLNMSNLSSKSQWFRLESSFIEIGVLQHDTLYAINQKIEDKDYKVINHSLRYLDQTNQLDQLLLWDKNDMFNAKGTKLSKRKILRKLGIKANDVFSKNENEYFNISANIHYSLNLDSFEYMVPIDLHKFNSELDSYIYLDFKTNQFKLKYKDEISVFEMPDLSYIDFENHYTKENDIWLQNELYQVLIKFQILQGKFVEGSYEIDMLEGYGFIRRK